MKDSLFVSNGWNMNGGIYLPLLSNSNKNNIAGNFSAGVEAELSYSQQKADGGRSAYTNVYHLQDGTIAPASAGSTPHAGMFQILVGPKAEWLFGRVAVSPSILLGYMSLKRNAYTLSGTVASPKQTGESKNIPIITTTDYSASGFVLHPKIEIGYHLTPQLSLFAGGALAFGPSFENNFSYWKPQGNAGTGGTYSYDQFASGSAKTAVFNGRWQAASVSMGLRYTWVKSTRMPSRLSMTPTTTRQTQGKTFGEKVSGGLQSGGNAISTDSTKKPGGAVSSSYAAGRVMQQGDTNTTRMPSRLSMTPTTARQTQGKTFGEKVSGGLQSGGNAAQMVAGNPIPGIVVKGGKNPPVKIISSTSNNKGEVLLKGLEPGSYLFTLSEPGQSAVVKGGKDPGTSFTNLTVNSQGQIGFEVLEAGDYKLIIEAQAPGNPPANETRKKVIEKASSGLKDTLKTNV
ncbi:MAG TPA: hypothetical protein VHC48_20380 [Puia sp.]|nr:hypothetical protein [Puia sp.]